jgi:hypothetical protein
MSMLKDRAGRIAQRTSDKLGGGGGIITILLPIIMQLLQSVLGGGNLLPCLNPSPTPTPTPTPPTPTGDQLKQLLSNPTPWQELGFKREANYILRQNGLRARLYSPAVVASSKEVAAESSLDEHLALYQEINGTVVQNPFGPSKQVG